MSDMAHSDFIVIGAGIAGASAAAALAAHGTVRLLEMEAQPGYHATGRSAAFFAAAYGSRVIRRLTGMCEPFLLEPPSGFSEAGLIRLRDCMFFGRPDQEQQLLAMRKDNPRLEFRTEAEVLERVPVFRPGYLHGAMWESMGGDIDVDALLQGFLRWLRQRGGRISTSARVTALEHRSGQWVATAGADKFTAPVVVNAAGAWADTVAEMAGLGGLGVKPLLRSAMLIEPPEGLEIEDWPMMIDANEDFYFKPDAGLLMICPADETPSPPCDAQPDDFEMAVGIDRFEKATGLDVRRVSHSWAGLRTFAPDRKFVAGFDPRGEGFFWLAGQGGYGVQSAPALAQLTMSLVTGSAPEPGFEGVSEFVADLVPDRLL
jgi:D-arginine dehydrogenase